MFTLVRVLEIEIAIIVGCLPILPAFFRQKKMFSLGLGSLSSLRYGIFKSRNTSASKDQQSSFSQKLSRGKDGSQSEDSYIQLEEGNRSRDEAEFRGDS